MTAQPAGSTLLEREIVQPDWLKRTGLFIAVIIPLN